MEYNGMFKIDIHFLPKAEKIRQIILMTEDKKGAHELLLALSTEVISLSKKYNAEKVVPGDEKKAYKPAITGYINAAFCLKFQNDDDIQQFYYDIEEYLACFL